MPSSTANWHWKNKNITNWGKDWFERELVTIVVRGDGQEEIAVSNVTDFEGDIELGQRKSKYVCLAKIVALNVRVRSMDFACRFS